MNDYDRFSPTKQNLLCNGQSALETILNHQDFLPHNTGNKSIQLGMVSKKMSTCTHELINLHISAMAYYINTREIGYLTYSK